MNGKGKISLVTALVIGCATVQAKADCRPRDFIIQDIKSVQQSAETELAFVLTSTEEEYNKVKQQGSLSGGYGLITGSANYGEAKEKARRIAQAIHFDYTYSYASNYFSQTISSAALDGYTKCLTLDKESPGLRLWLVQRDGDYFTFNAYWVGADTKIPAAQYDKEPIINGGEIVSKPDAWIKGTTEEIVVKRTANNDFFLRLNVGGQNKSIVIVKDPAAVVWKTKPVKSLRLMKAASHGPNPGCTAGADSDCISPSEPGGFLKSETATVTERKSSDPNRYKEAYTKSSVDQICVSITQDTGACEVNQVAEGRLTAIENYPVVAPE